MPFIGRGGSSPPSDTTNVQVNRLFRPPGDPFANGLLAVENRGSNEFRRVRLHRRGDVGVNVQGNPDACMPKAFLHDPAR